MKFYKILLISLVYCYSAEQLSHAQTLQISGKIMDAENRAPLMGVEIITADTSETGISDIDGSFKLYPETEEGELVFSYLGYVTKRIPFDKENRQLEVKLQPNRLELNEIIVQAFNSFKRSKDIPAAVASVDAEKIQQGTGISLKPVMNSIPGVKMDQSTPADSRISIRGSGVRSPWAIRNLKLYVNDIPITETDGTTRVESINIGDLGNAEIIKGPASSVYGGGAIGGVINLRFQEAKIDESTMSANGLIGAHGLRKIGGDYRSGREKMNSYISYGYMEYDGYREHSKDLRRFLSGNFSFYPSEKQEVTLLLNRSTQESQIPGSLTKEQMEENPRQANAENADKQAGRYQTWTRVGVGHRYDFDDHWSNTTSIFTYSYDLDHPLSYAYLRNFYQSYGGRTNFNFNPEWKVLNTNFNLGGEFNQAKDKGTQYENHQGIEGAIRSNIDNRNTYYTLFFQAETELTEKMNLTLGGSYNRLKYEIHDYINPEQTGEKDFKGQFSPRIALSYDFGKFLSLHGSVSSGFAPPTTNEVSLPDGAINHALNAEKAINYEIDAKGGFLNGRINYDLALYILKMKNELIEQTVMQNVSVYHNSGRSTHAGGELAVSYQLIRQNDQKWFTKIRPYIAATYSDYKFDDFEFLDENDEVVENFKDKKLPGISPWMVYAGVDLDTEIGWYLNAHYYFNDKAPLNNANSDYNPGYQLVDFQIGYKTMLWKRFDLNMYAGMDNILDKKYSSYTSINAVAWGGGQPAYFEPSPGRSGFMGINFTYNF